MSPQLTLHPSEISLRNLHELLIPITISPSSSRAQFYNFSETFHCAPVTVFEPETEYQCELILELARREGKKVRVVGAGFSPSDLTCTNEFMLRTDKLNRILEISSEKRYVIAQGGVTLARLHEELAKYGLAMTCIGSVSDPTLAGVIATASHGSGINFGVIPTQVMAVTLMLADGSRMSCSRTEHNDLFLATLCGLGATGIILSVQMEVEPAFRLRDIQESLPFHSVVDGLDSLAASAEHIRFTWFPATDTVRCSFADRTKDPKLSTGNWWLPFIEKQMTQLLLFMGRTCSPLNALAARLTCWLNKEQSVRIDDGHRIFNIDCKHSQFTTEWAIPFDNAKTCLTEIDQWLKQEHADPHGLRPHCPVEVRFTSADDIWLSPSNGRRTCWIGIIQYRPYGYNVPYRQYFKRFEGIMSRHQGRPHWAKAHSLGPDDLRKLYPRFDDFVQIVHKVDPRGIFHNEYIGRHIFGRPISGRIFKERH